MRHVMPFWPPVSFFLFDVCRLYFFFPVLDDAISSGCRTTHLITGNTFAPSPFIRLAPININSTTLFAPSLIKLKGGTKNPRCKIKIKYHTWPRVLPLSFEQDASPSRKNISFPRLQKSSSGGNLSRLVSLFYPDNSWNSTAFHVSKLSM